jgi:shikimate dehydrogenase
MDTLKITGTTKLLGVMGYPIEHSLSPIMHNAAIQHLGLDYVYTPFPVAPQDLATVMKGLEAIDCRGFNVTIPHKQTVMSYLQEVSPIAQAIGAVNTVWPIADGWAGTNTDILGFMAPLQLLPPPHRAVILGYGGAARAVVAACQELGCTEIWVVGRDIAKLAQFQASWSQVNLQVQSWKDMDELLPTADLVVHCTPLGMHPHVTDCPLTAAQIQLLRPAAIVYDLIYTPRPTQLLKLAKTQGCQVIDGLEMLVNQGAVGLERWLNQPAPVAVMRQSLLQHLENRK